MSRYDILTYLAEQRPYIASNPLISEEALSKRDLAKLAIIGSSCSGKSTLVDSLRTENITVPHRFTTRGARLNDNTIENTVLLEQEFNKKLEQRTIVTPWQRDLGDRKVQYGFEPVHLPQDLIVLSANNAFYDHFADSVQRPLIIEVICPYSDRARRMQERSPDLSSAEVAARLSDHPFYYQQEPHGSIPNYFPHAKFSLDDIQITEKRKDVDVRVYNPNEDNPSLVIETFRQFVLRYKEKLTN